MEAWVIEIIICYTTLFDPIAAIGVYALCWLLCALLRDARSRASARTLAAAPKPRQPALPRYSVVEPRPERLAITWREESIL